MLHEQGRKLRCRTKRLALLGGDGFTEPPDGTPAAHLAGRYGTLAARSGHWSTPTDAR
ncbi:MAG: hypothetical protein QM733_19645 [Ilumatobacteraceae bacterium]